MNRSRGFTLIELMITVAIVAILAKVALPSYTDYVKRGRIVEATELLSEAKVAMEQAYANNRTYAGAAFHGSTDICTTAVSTESGTFSMLGSGCNTTGFTLTATGSGSMAGFTYKIDQANVKQTTAAPSGWGPTSTVCWIKKKGGVC